LHRCAAFSNQVPTFLISRFFQGIGAGACYVVAFAILRDVLDNKQRGKLCLVLWLE